MNSSDIEQHKAAACILRGRYVGDDPKFKGKTALIEDRGGGYYVQFDDTTLAQAYGWWQFKKTDFEII